MKEATRCDQSACLLLLRICGVRTACVFLYYAQQEIHIPLERPPADQPEHLAHCAKITSFPERQTLCMMMSALDAEVGRFVADLKARGMWDNTLLWVVTDVSQSLSSQLILPLHIRFILVCCLSHPIFLHVPFRV